MLEQSSIPLGNLKAAIPVLLTTASHPEWQNLENIDVPLYQRHVSATIDEAIQLCLLSTASSICEQALVHSSAFPHAGDWLNGVPSSTLGLHFKDQESRVACAIG